jgi:hypothetical protein
VGIARMGSDAKKSVLKARIQFHRLPEPNPHDHGALRAIVRLPDGRVEEGKRLNWALSQLEAVTLGYFHIISLSVKGLDKALKST